MTGQWTWKKPTKPGWYWFCGTIWGHSLDMVPVKVRGSSSGLVFTTMNSFLYPGSGECIGVWQEAVVPEVPIKEVK